MIPYERTYLRYLPTGGEQDATGRDGNVSHGELTRPDGTDDAGPGGPPDWSPAEGGEDDVRRGMVGLAGHLGKVRRKTLIMCLCKYLVGLALGWLVGRWCTELIYV